MIYKGMKIGSYMKSKHSINGTRFTDDILSNVTWEVEFQMVSLNADVHKLSRSLERAITWFETLHNVVVVSPEASPDFTNVLMGMTDNNIMFVPHSATDEIIVMLIHKKIQSLLGGICAVGEMTLKASDNAIMSCYVPDTDNEIELPLDDYMRGYKTTGVDYWWLRNDGFNIEFAIPESSDVDVNEIYNDIEDPLDIYMGTYEDDIDDGDDGAQVIKFTNGD